MTRVRWAPALGVVQLGALVAAALLALTSTGDAAVLAVALGVGAGAALPGLVVALAAVAATVRWGTPDLGDLAGTQSVLGPAGLVGPRMAAASSWAAALAVVLAWPGPSPAAAAALPGPAAPARTPVLDRLRAATEPAHALGAVAVGGTASVLVWGPGLAGGWPGRVLATAVGAVATLVVGELRRHRQVAVGCGMVAAGLGVVAVLAAIASRPGRPATGLEVPLPWVSVLVAVGAAVVAVGGSLLGARRRTADQGARPGTDLARWAAPAASLALLAAAARLAGDLDPGIATPAPPSGGLAAAGTLLALAAVVAALAGPGIGAVAAAPGAVAAAHALLAAPPEAAFGATVALGGAVAVVTVALVVAATTAPLAPWGSPAWAAAGESSAPLRLRAALGVAAAGTLVLVPGVWSWAGVQGLDPWGEGAAVALAAGAATAVLATLRLRGARGSSGPPGRYARAVPGGPPGRTSAGTGAPAPARSTRARPSP